jgi:hypothetical protein
MLGLFYNDKSNPARSLSIAASGSKVLARKSLGKYHFGLANFVRTLPPLNFLYTSGFYGRPPAITTTDPRPDPGQHRQNGYRYHRPQAQDVSENRARKDGKAMRWDIERKPRILEQRTLIQHTATVTARPLSQTMTTSSCFIR